ncbi:MAG: helix-hairpin-helix domain-containing protein [Ignavibacteriaceae bacterium]|nr:helix-hairpin-helix domain-containing protein [Ignavibacteriaceae bacterium]
MSLLFSDGKFFLLLFLIGWGIILYPQTSHPPDSLEKVSQYIIDEETSEGENAFEEIYQELIRKKKNINTVSFNELVRIPGIDSISALAIISYRSATGFIFSPEELRFINSLSAAQLNSVKRYFFTEERNAPSLIVNNYAADKYSHNLVTRIRKNDDGDNPGGLLPYRLFSRYVYHNSLFSLTLVTEKDPFEKNYLDHYSGSISFRSVPFFENVLIGDYRVNFGHGLILGSSYLNRKGISVIRDAEPFTNIHTAGIADENTLMRGISADLFINEYLSLNLFISYNERNTRTDSSGSIISFYESGYFTNSSESAYKRNTGNLDGGAIVRYSLSEIVSGDILLFNSNYSREFSNLFNRGLTRNNFYASVSNSFDLGFTSASLEYAIKSGGTSSFYLTTNTDLADKNILTLSLRNYSRGFLTERSSAFSENSLPYSEKGFYSGIVTYTGAGVISAYIDLYLFESVTVRGFELSGIDFLLHHNITSLFLDEIRTRVKVENKEELNLSPNPVKILNKTIEVRNEILHTFDEIRWRLITALRFTGADNKASGWLISNELIPPLMFQIRTAFRFTYYESDSFTSGIYVLERGAGSVFDGARYYGKGISFSMNADLKSHKFYRLAVKFRHTTRTDPGVTDGIDYTAYNVFALEFNLQL